MNQYTLIDIELDDYITFGNQIITKQDLETIHSDPRYQNIDKIIESNQLIIIKKPIITLPKLRSLSTPEEILIRTNRSLKSLKRSKSNSLTLTMDYFIKLIAESRIDELRTILQNDTNNIYINLRDKDQDSLLHFSVSANNYEITRLLLTYGLDPNITDNDGQSPLFRIVFADNLKIINLLLESGADINKQDNIGNTPLHIAVITKKYIMINTLLKLGAKTDMMNNDNLLAKDFAIIHKNDDVHIDDLIISMFDKFN